MCFVTLTFLGDTFLQLLIVGRNSKGFLKEERCSYFPCPKVQVQIWIVQANCMEAGMPQKVMWTSCGQDRCKIWSARSFFKLQTRMGITSEDFVWYESLQELWSGAGCSRNRFEYFMEVLELNIWFYLIFLTAWTSPLYAENNFCWEQSSHKALISREDFVSLGDACWLVMLEPGKIIIKWFMAVAVSSCLVQAS